MTNRVRVSIASFVRNQVSRKKYDNINKKTLQVKFNKIFSKTFKVLVASDLLKRKFTFLQQQ